MYRYVYLIERLSLNGNSRRMFMTLPRSRTKEYEGRQLIGFSMEQMYDVVADVENYNKFVPFCKKSDITQRSKEFLKANLMIGFPPINENYTSKVTTVYPRLVKAECTDGRLFNHLNTLWIFSPGLKNNPQTCVIDFSLSFEFKSIIHTHLSNFFFNEIVRQMEKAFIEEAKHRYGRPCIKTVRLERYQPLIRNRITYLIKMVQESKNVKTCQPCQRIFYQPRANIEVLNSLGNKLTHNFANLRRIQEVSGEDDSSEKIFRFSKIGQKIGNRKSPNKSFRCIGNRKRNSSSIRPSRRTTNDFKNGVDQFNSKVKNAYLFRLSGGKDSDWSTSTTSSSFDGQFQKTRKHCSRNIKIIDWNKIQNEEAEIKYFNPRKRKLDTRIKYRRAIVPKYKFELSSESTEKNLVRVSTPELDDFSDIKKTDRFLEMTDKKRNQTEILKSSALRRTSWTL